jgi:hypothetical protein
MVRSGGASAGTGGSEDGTGAVPHSGGVSGSGGDMAFAGTGGESIATGGETTGVGGETSSGGAASGGGIGPGGAPDPEDCTPATGAPGSGRSLDFQAVRHYPAGGNYAGTQLHFGDLNEDGDLEVITPLTQGGRIAILSGLGDATLSAATDHIIPGASNVQVFDFNGDGSLDFIAHAGTNIVYQAGNGDGTFAPSAIFVPSSGRALPRAADLVGGIDQDLILHAGTSLEIYEGDGSGQYALVHTLPTTLEHLLEYRWLDFNGDGFDDLTAIGDRLGYAQKYLAVALADPNGGFNPFTRYDFSADLGLYISTLTDLFAGDINEDGKDDILVEAGTKLVWLLGNAAGTASIHSEKSPTLFTLQSSGLVDIDGDQHLDLLTAGTQGAVLSIEYGNGDGTFESAEYFSVGDTPFEIEHADLDQDGIEDLVLSGGFVQVMRGEGNRNFNARPVIAVVNQPLQVLLAYMNDDPALDLLAIDASGLLLYPGNGDGTFLAPQELAFTDVPSEVRLLSTGPGARPDVLVRTAADQTFLLENDGDGVLSAPALVATGRELEVGELTGDALDDLLVATWQNATFLHAAGNGSFTPSTAHISGTSMAQLELVDVDNDRALDVLVTEYLDNRIRYFSGDGSGEFSLVSTRPTPSAGSTQTADFDGDCLLETLITGQGGAVLESFDPTRAFSPVRGLGFSGRNLPLDDLDEDGFPDVLNCPSSNAFCYIELYREGFAYERHYVGTSSAQGTAVGDLNGDLLPDAVIAHRNPGIISVMLNRSY